MNVPLDGHRLSHEFLDVRFCVVVRFAARIEMIDPPLADDAQGGSIEDAEFVRETLIVDVEFSGADAHVVELFLHRTKYGERLSAVQTEVSAAEENERLLVAIGQDIAEKLSRRNAMASKKEGRRRMFTVSGSFSSRPTVTRERSGNHRRNEPERYRTDHENDWC